MKNSRVLDITASGDHEIVITRAFDAPPRPVFDALTTPELIRRWLVGPPGWSMIVCEVDLIEGGAYRYVWRHDRDGTEMGMGGVYREIAPPHRLIHTESFVEPWYPGEALVATTLVERDGRTILAGTLRYESPEARDAVLESPMEEGVTASYDRLAELLASAGAREDPHDGD